MSYERPAFSLEAGKRSTSGLPVEAWVLAMAGFGTLVGSFMAHREEPCGPLANCTIWPAGWAAMLSAVFLSAAVAWFLLPVREEREALLRAAGLGTLVAGALAIVLALLPTFWNPLPMVVVVGLCAPAAMLSGLRPEAAIEWGSAKRRRTLLWLRAGGLPAMGGAAGLFLGWQVGAFGATISPATPRWLVGSVVAGVMLALAGVLVLALATIAPGGEAAEARPPAGRLRLFLRMTPMLRFDFLAEAALAFAGSATLAAVLLRGPVGGPWDNVVTALALGAAVGVVCYVLFAPTLDFLMGRGRFLSTAPLAGAMLPLAAGAGLAAGDPLPFFAAGALWAFATSSAPQRYALLYDLASSRGRMRVAADVHGAKLVVAALAPLTYLALELLLPGTGLLAASLLCLIAFAFFAPTLGGLGRRQK
jgi:hypothetical protein